MEIIDKQIKIIVKSIKFVTTLGSLNKLASKMVIFKFHYEQFVSKMTRSLSYKSLSIGGNQRDTIQGTRE